MTRYAQIVLKALPGKWPQVARRTGLAERTVKAQIEALRKAGAVKVAYREPSRRGGHWAVYRRCPQS